MSSMRSKRRQNLSLGLHIRNRAVLVQIDFMLLSFLLYQQWDLHL